MTYESKFWLWKGLVFRESFLDEQTVREQGTPTDVSFVGWKWVFNGSTSKIDISSKLSSLKWTSTGTWKFKLNHSTNDSIIFWFWKTGWSLNGIYLRIQANWTLLSIAWFNWAVKYQLETTSAIPTGDIDIIFTQDWISPILYVNWEKPNQTFTNQVDKTAWFSTYSALDTMTISSVDLGTWRVLYYLWSIDLVELYNYAWTAEQVANDYNNKTYLDIPTTWSLALPTPDFTEPMDSEAEVVSNGWTVTDVSFSNWIWSFNGSSSWIDYWNIHNITTQKFTLKTIFTSNIDHRGGIINKRLSADAWYRIETLTWNIIRIWLYDWSNGTIAASSISQSTEYTVIGTAEIVWWVWRVKIYVNWKLIQTTDSASWNSLSNGRSLILWNENWTNYFNGDINIAEIYENEVWTIEQVAFDYNPWTLLFDNDSRQWTISDRYGNTITNTGVTIKKDWNYYAQDYDGSSFLNIDSLVPELANTTVGSWVAWVKPVDVPPISQEFIMSFTDKSAVNEWIYFFMGDGNTLRAQYVTEAAVTVEWRLDVNTNPFSDNLWTHMALVHNWTEATIYINGVKPAQTFLIQLNKTFWFNNLSDVDTGRIGNRNVGSTERDYFTWKLNQQRIYTRVLSAAECMQLFTSTRHIYNV